MEIKEKGLLVQRDFCLSKVTFWGAAVSGNFYYHAVNRLWLEWILQNMDGPFLKVPVQAAILQPHSQGALAKISHQSPRM